MSTTPVPPTSEAAPAPEKLPRGFPPLSQRTVRVHTRLKDIQSLGTEATESPFFQAYLRFLLRVEAQGDDAGQENLEPNEKALLELVVLRWAKHQPLTVRQTIAHAHLGSPATLHKRLMNLRKMGYLQLQDVANDKRAKHLVPGPQGYAYMETMGKHMIGVRRSIHISFTR